MDGKKYYGPDHHGPSQKDLAGVTRRFLEILDFKSDSPSGKIFYPVYISSCQTALTAELYYILIRMKELTNENTFDGLVDRGCSYLDGSCKCKYPPTDCQYNEFHMRTQVEEKKDE